MLERLVVTGMLTGSIAAGQASCTGIPFMEIVGKMKSATAERDKDHRKVVQEFGSHCGE